LASAAAILSKRRAGPGLEGRERLDLAGQRVLAVAVALAPLQRGRDRRAGSPGLPRRARRAGPRAPGPRPAPAATGRWPGRARRARLGSYESLRPDVLELPLGSFPAGARADRRRTVSSARRAWWHVECNDERRRR
jgi:hypothetical protein